MLARRYRLRSSADFNLVYRGGRVVHSAHLTIRALATERGCSRLAVVVSNKVTKRAVRRNRMRRQIVSWLGRHWARLNGSYDLIISVKADISQIDFEPIAGELVDGLSRLGVWPAA